MSNTPKTQDALCNADTLRAARERLAGTESTFTKGLFALAFIRQSLDLAEAVEHMDSKEMADSALDAVEMGGSIQRADALQDVAAALAAYLASKGQ